MKRHLLILATTLLCCALLPVQAQFGPGSGPASPRFGGAMSKLFSENKSFSATMEMQAADPSGKNMAMQGKIAFDEGKSRFELDMTSVQGIPPEAAGQMKTMGMDKMVTISRPDTKSVYMIYPGMQSYVESKMPESEAVTNTSNFKTDITEIGKETVDGHPCIKNKVVITDDKGAKQECTVWNATDLEKFPLKIQSGEGRRAMTMTFKNVSRDKVASSQFDAPAGFTRYESMQSMMQQVMMKRMGGMGGGFGQ
jgi:outer membrane lipoprotein-sorting protein